MTGRADALRFPMVPPVRREDFHGLPETVQQKLVSDVERQIPRTI